MMKYSHAESQALLLVELLLNDPVMKCVTTDEVDSILTDHNGESMSDIDAAREALVSDVVGLIYKKAERTTLRDLLNSLSERGEITVLSIDNAANEIMINWCGMTGCVMYHADRNTWQMHT